VEKDQSTSTHRTSFGSIRPERRPLPTGQRTPTLWGKPQDGQLNGTLIKLPAGFTGKIKSHSPTFRAVVIKGQPQFQVPGETDVKTLEPGSYFGSKGESVYQVSSKGGAASIIYVHTEGKYNVIR